MGCGLLEAGYFRNFNLCQLRNLYGREATEYHGLLVRGYLQIDYVISIFFTCAYLQTNRLTESQ